MDEILYQQSRYDAKNAQHAAFVSEIMAKVTADLAEKYNFTPQYSAFHTAGTAELDRFKPDRGYLETEEVTKRDRVRDKTTLFYKQIISAYANYCPDDAKLEAGKTVYFAFREAGDVTHADLYSEYALLNDLVERLRTEPYASALTTLDLAEIPDEIEAANQSFIEIYNQRYPQVSQRASSLSTKELRIQTDDAFDEMAKAINTIYMYNEMVTKDSETREELKKLIADVNGVLANLRRILGQGNSGSGSSEEEPAPEPVEPAITEVYSKVEDVHDPTGITRGKETIMKWVGDFELVNETGDGPGKIIVKDNFTGVEEEVPVEDILSRSNTGCEFIMIRDFAEGEYKIRIETYDGGSPLVLEYPEVIKLV